MSNHKRKPPKYTLVGSVHRFHTNIWRRRVDNAGVDTLFCVNFEVYANEEVSKMFTIQQDRYLEIPHNVHCIHEFIFDKSTESTESTDSTDSTGSGVPI